MVTGLLHSHSGLGYIVAILSTVSVLVAVAGNVSSSAALRGAGKGLRTAEVSLIGLTAIAGLALWGAMGFPMALWPAHVGLLGIVVSSVILARVSKPGLVALSSGDESGAKRWLAGEALNWFVVMGTLAAMHSN